MCLRYAYIVIVNMLLIEHKIGYTMVSLDIFVVDTTPVELFSIEVISLDYVRSKDNIVDLLTKGLNRELVEKSLRGMRLKPIKEKVNTVDTQPS